MASYFWAWLVLFLLTYVAKVPLGLAQKNEGYNNEYPRLQQEKLKGLAHRSHAAHLNSFEALIGFTAAMSAALFSNAPRDTIALWAWIFVATRCLFIPLYWANVSTLRSVTWFVGIIALIRLFVAGAI